MERQRVTVPLTDHETISAIFTLPETEAPPREVGVITAHGAGNDMETPLIAAFTDGLAEAGYPALRFNFPYKEKGRRAPDRPEKLEDAWTAVYRFFLENSGAGASRIIAAGKSMGGRIASQMVAEGKLPVEGLIFLGYPLHPAGDPAKLRDAHLYGLNVPLLFFAGTRDRLCDLETLQRVLNRLPAPWNLETIEGGDHSFIVPRSSGISESEIFARIVRTAIQWLESAIGSKSAPMDASI